jgi:hypothetical protein
MFKNLNMYFALFRNWIQRWPIYYLLCIWTRKLHHEYSYNNLWFWCLTPLSAIFQLYHGDQFEWWKKPNYPERSTDHGQATGKLYHLRLRVECTRFCNLQSRARTHAVLVIGFFELLGNPTTQLIEPPGPLQQYRNRFQYIPIIWFIICTWCLCKNMRF